MDLKVFFILCLVSSFFLIYFSIFSFTSRQFLAVTNRAVSSVYDIISPFVSISNKSSIWTHKIYKSSTPSSIFHAHFPDIDTLPKSTLCLTNGSILEDRVGLAYPIGSQTFTHRHPTSASIFTALWPAIYQCLEIIFDRSYLICSNSLVSLIAISNLYTVQFLIKRTYILLTTLTTTATRFRR